MPAERARRRRQVQERLGERLGERLPESRWREACRGRQPKRSGGNSGSRECDSPSTHSQRKRNSLLAPEKTNKLMHKVHDFFVFPLSSI
jgi:hypothetical protein